MDQKTDNSENLIVSPNEPGRKFDVGKLRYDLFPPYAEEEIIKVLNYGALKYDADNWIHVQDASRRYYAASRRHQAAWLKARLRPIMSPRNSYGQEVNTGSILDSESGIHHLAHAAINLIFLLEHDMFNFNGVKPNEVK